MADLIQKTDTLNQGREKLNKAIDDANRAKWSAEQALAKSTDTQTQLNTIVIDGDSSVEAAQARVDEKGVAHETLKARLDDGFNNISTQLTGTASKEEISTLESKLNSVPIKETIQETTANRSWSTSAKELTNTINDEEVVFRTAPKSVRKRIVVYGSSSAEGFYATTGNSWFEKLRVAMEPLGWDVLLRALSGDNTDGAISRFHKDVSPYKPDICIISFTIGNEGINTSQSLSVQESIIDKFKSNILTLALLCKQNGIIPVVVDQFPTKRYNGQIYRLAELLNKEIEYAGLKTINFKGAIDAVLPSGVPLNLAMHDDLHPNDVGHNAMFETINPNMFKYLLTTQQSLESKGGYIRTPSSITDTTIPISFTPSVPIKSFTVFFRMKAVEPVIAQRTWAGFGAGDLRISNQNDSNHSLDLRGGGMSSPIITDVGLDDMKEHSVCVTFNNISKSVKFYVDGKLFGTETTLGVDFTELTLAGRRVDGVIGINMAFKDLLIYRTRLSDAQVHDLHNGHYSKGSLDLFSPLNDIPRLNARLVNLAPTDEHARINTASLTAF